MAVASPVGEQITPATAQARDLTITHVSGRRRMTNRAASVLICGASLVVLIPLLFILAYVVKRGIGIMSWDFLTKDIPKTDRRLGPGMGPAVLGTLEITGMATLLAVPVGILAAVYVNEYGRANRLAAAIRFLADVMAGVPSIVMGLFVYAIWVLRFREQTGFAGSLALACLMLPIVIRATESMLRLVPDDLREASTALGCRKSRTILTVVLPAALPGITSGCLLAIARAAGETAPLVFTIGIVTKANKNLFSGSTTALPAQIFNNANKTLPGPQERAWGAALTLICLVLILTVIARAVSARFSVKAD